MGTRIRQFVRLFSARSILPLYAPDRARFFRLAAILRMLIIAVLGSTLVWLLRDESMWLVIAAVVWIYPGIAVTWLIYRRYGFLSPHIWLRDLVGLAFFSALLPGFLVPAMMTSLIILAFSCFTIERRSVIALAVSAVVLLTAAAGFHPTEAAIVALVFFPIAVAAITALSSMPTGMMRRTQAINERIADALGLCLWETVEREPSSANYLHGTSERLLGHASSVVMTHAGWEAILHPDDFAVGRQIDEAIAAGNDYRVRYRQLHSDGEYRWIEEVGHVQLDDGGKVVKVLGMTHDVSKLVETDEQLTQLDSLVESIEMAVAVLRLDDADDPESLTIVYENRVSRDTDAGPPRRGKRLCEVSKTLYGQLGTQLAEVARGGEAQLVRDVRVEIGGRELALSVRMSPLPKGHVAVTFEDLTELFETRRELERLAYVDQLTGLPNRVRLRQLLAAATPGTVLAVLDLDRFTEINDAFGHSCGDEVVLEIARMLSETEPGVVVARLGGDEFGILVPPDVEHRNRLGERVTEALSRPVTLPSGLTLQTSASIGTTTKTKADMSPDELLRQADVAMNRAKRFRCSHESYEARNDTSAPHRMMLLGELRRAIRGHELELHYQPIADPNGEIKAVEGMLHWRHPTLGLLPPADFVEMLELSSLNRAITSFVVQAAVDQAVEWHRAGLSIPVSVNVGGATLHDADLVGELVAMIVESGLPPLTIGLEFTERHLMLGAGISGESLRRLVEAGAALTIDQFATDSSPLAAVRHVPANFLKVGRVLVNDVRNGDPSVVGALAIMARARGLVLAADDVDDEVSLRSLLAIGVDRVQGAAVAAAAPAEEITMMLMRHVPLPIAH